jgi:cytochrome c oxidase subunit III
MLFAGLISAAAVLRAGYEGVWPPANQPRLPTPITLANLLILLISGATLAAANRRPKLVLLTALLGAAFLAVQGYEWSRLISFGLANNAGPYAGMFYAIIATHGLHVAGGLACLLWCCRHTRAIRVCSMYWYFVVGVWPILYLLVYV